MSTILSAIKSNTKILRCFRVNCHKMKTATVFMYFVMSVAPTFLSQRPRVAPHFRFLIINSRVGGGGGGPTLF